jgi:hypothetical protein
LCGKRLGIQTYGATAYPLYVTLSEGVGFFIRKIFTFFVIAASAITVFINIFTYRNVPVLWSFVVAVSLIFTWHMVNVVVTRKSNTGRRLLNSYFAISIFLIVIDIYGGFLKWSTTYVIPFLTILLAFLFTVLAARSKKHFNEYMGNLLAIFIISICPILVYMFSLSTQGWSSMVAILYCFLTIVGLVLFMGRAFREEIKKRFYY